MPSSQSNIEVSEISMTLNGLIARRYYQVEDRDDDVIEALKEAANELGVSLSSEGLESSVTSSLRSAERSGIDISKLSGRDTWKTVLHYETS